MQSLMATFSICVQQAFLHKSLSKHVAYVLFVIFGFQFENWAHGADGPQGNS